MWTAGCPWQLQSENDPEQWTAEAAVARPHNGI